MFSIKIYILVNKSNNIIILNKSLQYDNNFAFRWY